MLGILWEEFLRQLIWDDCSIVYLGYQHFYDYKYIIDRAKDNIHPIMIFPYSFHLSDNVVVILYPKLSPHSRYWHSVQYSVFALDPQQSPPS
jgi:hypothetical protein